ncbi:MAG: ParB N-terminal domain-containing protein, partial [bacterium]|nr:ParB N-terminal domain-containing protein [bacterium]
RTDSDLAVEWVMLDALHPTPANPRVNAAAVDPVASSIRRFGWQAPIVAKPNGEIVAGHTRFKAAQKLGLDTVPAFRFTGSDIDAVAFGIADNKTASIASWDEPALAKLLAQLQVEDALDGVGFSEQEVALLLRAQEDEVDEDDGSGEVPEHPVSKAGDLWLLGDHRLLCGDSTDAACMVRLLAGERPRLMVTDPPYGVEYDPSWRNEAGVSSTRRTG